MTCGSEHNRFPFVLLKLTLGTRFHRAMTRPFFTRERISDFEIYDRNADLSLQEARKRLSEGYSFDFQVT